MKGKKILISCNRILSLGGIEKALTTFIKAFDTENNDVTLVLHNREGELYKELDLTNVKTIFIEDYDTASLLKNEIIHFQFIRIIKSLYYRFMLRNTKDWYARIMYTYKIIAPAITIPGHYDIAMSFTSDYSDLSIVLNVDADKRACMVHGDPTRNPEHAKLNDPLMRKMDRIFCVSDGVKKQFLKVHPSCEAQMDTMHNILYPDEIINKSKEPEQDIILDDSITLCTVGRLEEVKGQQLIPKAAKILIEKGYKIRWYIVGEGNLRSIIENEIQQFKIQNSVFLVGAKTNPYPFIANSDIYVQTSLSEAYCITLAEARILCKPIVTTNFVSCDEQIVNYENGIIVSEMTAESISEGVINLLSNNNLRVKIIENLSKNKYCFEQELSTLYSFIES